METTMTNNMIIPQVVSDLVESKLGQRLSLLPLTQVDDSLQGKPGDTLQFPAFRYIGKAEQVAENGQVQAGVLSADTVSAKVKKYAKAVRITDEARLAGYGDPVGEAAKQLAQSIDHAVDDALFGVLADAGLSRKMPVAALSSEAVVDGLTLFGEDQDGDKVLLTDAQGFARLRKDPNYIRASDLGQRMVFSGAVGEIWGCQILLSQKVAEDAQRKEKQHFILKPGALRLVLKQGTQVEVEREPEYMRDTLFCSKHCAAYLYDAGKVVSLTEFIGLEQLTMDSGIQTRPAGVGGMYVDIPARMQAPQGFKWVYKLDDDPAPQGVYGTAVAAATDWPGSEVEVATGGKTSLHLFLVKAADQKPVKALTLPAFGG